ncbi:synaptic vesicle glycoprotein 2B-like [Periplaneta americana]|uniref:synaptic vesicle glycoprotein 2B-like n=1 Tax=Periplaneta americana TaxID=6978 RepID=UPI0037E92095
MSATDIEIATDLNCSNERNGEPKTQSTTSFEEAIKLTGHGKFHLFLLLACGACLVAMVAEAFGTAFIIPPAQCEFEMGAFEKGILNAITYVGMISSSHLWGYLADTQGRRKMLILSLFLDAICAVLSSIAPTFWLFCLLRYFNGFFICAPSAVIFAYLGEFHSATTRTKAIMLMSPMMSIGGLLQQGLAWLIIPQEWALDFGYIVFSSWRIYILIFSLPSFIASTALIFLPESPKFLLSIGEKEKAMEVLRQVYAINSGQSPKQYAVSEVIMDENESSKNDSMSATIQPKSVLEIIKSMWLQTKPLFQYPNLLITSLAFTMQFIFYASFNGFALWLPDIYNRLSQYSEKYPNHTPTICEVIDALKSSTAIVIRSPDILNQSSANLTIEEHVNWTYGEPRGLSAIDTLVNFSINYDYEGVIPLTNVTSDIVSCTSVNPDVFRNGMLIGCVCMVVYTTAGYIANFIRTHKLIRIYMLVTSIEILSLYFVNTEVGIVALASLFIATTGVCVNMLNSIVVENIPTQLRAMAVCLSLMSGRLGVTVFSLVIGVLLEAECSAVFIMYCGMAIVACVLSCLLPKGPSKSST